MTLVYLGNRDNWKNLRNKHLQKRTYTRISTTLTSNCTHKFLFGHLHITVIAQLLVNYSILHKWAIAIQKWCCMYTTYAHKQTQHNDWTVCTFASTFYRTALKAYYSALSCFADQQLSPLMTLYWHAKSQSTLDVRTMLYKTTTQSIPFGVLKSCKHCINITMAALSYTKPECMKGVLWILMWTSGKALWRSRK